jgi:hypothetical protein
MASRHVNPIDICSDDLTLVQVLARGFYGESEQPGWAQSHEISTPAFASLQRWLQYCLLSATLHWHAGCAHLFFSILAMTIYPSYLPSIGTKTSIGRQKEWSKKLIRRAPPHSNTAQGKRRLVFGAVQPIRRPPVVRVGQVFIVSCDHR